MDKKIEAIEFLKQFDHGFLSEAQVRQVTQPFGFMGYTYVARANPEDFKGLSLWDEKGKPIKEMRGQDAAETAKEICDYLGVSYVPQYGRGSQLQVCCEALLRHLSPKVAATAATH